MKSKNHKKYTPKGDFKKQINAIAQTLDISTFFNVA
jgi:hypothetical protein